MSNQNLKLGVAGLVAHREKQAAESASPFLAPERIWTSPVHALQTLDTDLDLLIGNADLADGPELHGMVVEVQDVVRLKRDLQAALRWCRDKGRLG